MSVGKMVESKDSLSVDLTAAKKVLQTAAKTVENWAALTVAS
jgi:hypothetical protein